MEKTRILGLVLAAVFCCGTAGNVFSMGKKDVPETQEGLTVPEKPAKDLPTVSVTGLVRLVGSNPLPDIVISADDGVQWYIERQDQKILMDFQQRRVTVEGKAETEELVLADGRSAGIRNYLREIRLIE
ncbi:hypothetical protein [Breznakiella homolactica]|uniref:Uncharacterized protein n=1 Tax=Breznakiella homolactica TaxID=2798577 RepID=A0A7T7XQ50_9SPIR|nr:hypothetical protein [Breznakiella homolactica]QQO10471.1 hypothetical protein JFL75_06030 [Breznakiella homolactica]